MMPKHINFVSPYENISFFFLSLLLQIAASNTYQILGGATRTERFDSRDYD